MLLTIDVGNTNTVFGVFEGEKLKTHWRVQTRVGATSDEYMGSLATMFGLRGLDRGQVRHAALACVVPPLQDVIVEALVDFLDVGPLVVGPGVRTGMPLLLDNPKEVGADRVANAVAAYDACKKACIVVDFGTAITLDMISSRGEYLGGAIAPGIQISVEALHRAAAKLPKVPLLRPRKVVGKNTEESIQSGVIFGYASMVDGMIERMLRELGIEDFRIFATGGHARLMVGASQYIRDMDEFLTLRGLRLLHLKNKP